MCGRDKQLVDNPLAGVFSRSGAKGRWAVHACSMELRLQGDEEGGEEGKVGRRAVPAHTHCLSERTRT